VTTDPEAVLCQALEQRDQALDLADLLAAAIARLLGIDIARLLGIDIGEHSSMNDPWTNALAAADHHAPLAAGTEEG
jgi:hypothetical protein